MEKNYQVKQAIIQCNYGGKSYVFQVPDHRHIMVTENEMGNEADFGEDCLQKDAFQTCCSPYRLAKIYSSTLPLQDKVENLSDLAAAGLALPCELALCIPWQSTKKDVKIAYYKALLETSWTVCATGFGILRFLNSGQ